MSRLPLHKGGMFLFLFILAFLSAACKQEEISLYGSIIGTVTDSYTKEPIKGAQVRNLTFEQTCLTGSDGGYAFRDLKVMAENRHVIQVMADGYETEQKSILVNTGDDNRLDFALTSSKPVLEVSEGTVDFEKTYTTHTVSLKNVGMADLNWEANEDVAWLSCTPTNGTVRKGGQTSLELKVDRSGLGEGPYSANVSISSNGGSAQIIIKMHVEGMSVAVSPSELDFGESTTNLPLTLESNREVRYYLEPSNAWIIPSKSEGLFTGTEYLSVTVDRTKVSAGKYDGKLILRVGSATKEIAVRMTKPSKQAPLVACYSVSDISYGSAVFNGAVVSVGSSKITRHGFCWSEEKEPDIDKWYSCDFGDCQSAADLPSYQASDLKPNTKYHVCTYAENSDGLSYSEVVEFTTQALPSAPSVETGTISMITNESVSVTGNILSVGNDTGVTEHGHVWSTSPSPTTENLKTSLGRKDKAGVFTSELKGLSPNTTYHVRAYAVNSIGTTYGEDKTFITLPDEMKVSTSSAESITHNSATLGGYITYDGGNVVSERGVCWAEHKNPTIDDDCKASGDQGEKFSVRVQTLTAQTAYYYRAYVIAETGKIYYGNDVFFNTTHEILLPKTAAVSIFDINTDMAVASSSVVDDGRGTISEVGFVYSKSINPTIDDFKVSCGADKTEFSVVLYDLEDNTTYYVRSYAVNEAGTGYGEETFFTTLELKVPDVSGTEVSGVTYNSASFSAVILGLNNGSLKDAGFVYSTSPDPDLNSTKISCRSTDMHIATTATSLSANTLYYVRAYATNEKGTAYGATQSFQTSEAPQIPVVRTGTVSDIAHDSAVVSGEIVKLGVDSGLTEYGHVWSLDSDPDINDNRTRNGAASVLATYTSEMTGLSPNTTYYVRAYATNELGTAYGEVVSFTTEDILLPEVSDVEILKFTHRSATFSADVTDLHNGTLKDSGFVYSTSSDPDIDDNIVSCGNSGTHLSGRAIPLDPSTKYYVRAYAVNEKGIAYGAQTSFTTLDKSDGSDFDMGGFEGDENDWN